MKAFLFAPLLSLALFASATPFAQAADFTAPKLSGAVVDEVGLLDSGDRAQLESQLRTLSDSGAAQVVVLVASSLQGLDIADYGIRLAEAWKIGFKGGEKGKDTNRDRGAIFIIAPQQRAMRIEVGYGLEGEIPDATASRILEEIVKPNFQANRFSKGIVEGTTAISRLAQGDGTQVFPARGARRGRNSGSGELLIVGLIILFVISRSKRFYYGIPASGILGYVVGASFLSSAILGTVGAVVLYGLLRLIPSSALHSTNGGRFGGGGFGGGGFGGSGGGGFGGGGGSFGGGGSSSSW